jgi:hypothetical protein
LDDQQAFFKALREQVGAVMAGKSPEETKTQAEVIRATLKANAQIARFVGTAGSDDSFPSQVHKAYEELAGKNLAALKHEPHFAARHTHTLTVPHLPHRDNPSAARQPLVTSRSHPR